MQLSLFIRLKKPFCIPLNYNHQLQSAIYAKLTEANAENDWHNMGFGQHNEFKAFVFGSINGNYTIKGSQICFNDTISIEIRSPIFQFIDELQRSFEVNPRIKLFDTILSICEMKVTNLHINSSQAVFETLSPVIARSICPDGKTVYHSPEDAIFVTILKNNFYRKYLNICNEQPAAIEITPLGKHKKIVTQYKGLWITAYSGKYEIQGPPKTLEFIYNAGLGIKNAQGFGLLKIIE